jgi:hypothetical protein
LTKQTFSGVERICVQDAQVDIRLEKRPPWEAFKPNITLQGHAKAELNHGTLDIITGDAILWCPERRSFDLKVCGGDVRGVHLGGELRIEGSSTERSAIGSTPEGHSTKNLRVALAPQPQQEAHAPWLSCLQDLVFIFGLAGLMMLAFSPLFSPPRYADSIIIAAASLYLGLNPSSKRILGISLCVGIVSLLTPWIQQGLQQQNWAFQAQLSYLFNIALYLILWGGGKRLKDRYRGATL